MKTITIKTQAELDALPNEFEENTEINIIGKIQQLNKQYKNGFVVLSGNCVIEYAYGNCVIESAYDNCVIESAYDNCLIKYASGNCVIKSAYGNCVIESAYGNCVIKYAYGNCVIKSAYGNCVIKSAYDNCVIESAYGNCVIKSAYDNCVIESAYGNCVIESAYDNCVIKYAYDNCLIKSASDNCVIKLLSNNSLIHKATKEVVIICQDCNPKIKDLKANINYTKSSIYTKDDFIYLYGSEAKDITLYKSVNPNNNCDFYTGKIKYEGIVKCPDWNPDESIQCGNGLHLSPTPQMALSYNKGKVLKCSVAIEDFVVYKNDITKVRCSKVKVIEEVKL